MKLALPDRPVLAAIVRFGERCFSGGEPKRASLIPGKMKLSPSDTSGTSPLANVTGRIIAHGPSGNDKVSISLKVSKGNDL